MRLSTLSTVITIALVSFSAQAFADDLTVETKINAATVFADRATLTRTATVDIPAGDTTLVISDLPGTLFADSLRTEGTAKANVILGAIESKTVSSAEIIAPRQRELNDKIEQLNTEKTKIEANNQSLGDKISFLRNLGQQASLRSREDIAAIDLKPEQWLKAANTVSSGIDEAEQARINNTIRIRDIQEEINALQREISKLGRDNRSTYQVRIPLESDKPTTLTLSLSYQLPQATWHPVYDARLDTETGKLTLVQYGEVQQQTGEDWKDVKLTLSTAQPARSAALPPLYTMWVDIERIQGQLKAAAYGGAAPMASRRMEAQSNIAFDEVDASAPEMDKEDKARETTFRAATINAGDFVGTYDIPGTNDVMADGSARKVMIGTLDVESQIVIKVKPQISSDAFLVAVTKLGGEVPLLAGNANLFRDGAYIGSTSLPLLRPGEETDLGFGIDDQVVVKHNVVKDETGESGVIARDTTRTRHTVTTVQNLHKKPVKLALLQTLPTPRNERITLDLDNKTTRGGFDRDVNNIKGQLRWTLDLAPDQKESFPLGWSLSWPKGDTLSGLDF